MCCSMESDSEWSGGDTIAELLYLAKWSRSEVSAGWNAETNRFGKTASDLIRSFISKFNPILVSWVRQLVDGL